MLVVGAALWGGYRLTRGPQVDTIVVAADTVTTLREGFLRQQGREPSRAELDQLVDAWVEQELLVREARAQGLDRADPIVRRRLIQKLRFVLEDTDARAGDDDPGDEVLAGWYHGHSDRYRRPPRRGFTHVFVAGFDADAEARARALVVALAAGTDPARMGDAFPLGRHQGPADPRVVADRYGEALAQAVAAAPLGRWISTRSSFGWHALRVDDERPGALPELSEIRSLVLADWRVERRAASLERGLAALRERYAVEVER